MLSPALIIIYGLGIKTLKRDDHPKLYEKDVTLYLSRKREDGRIPPPAISSLTIKTAISLHNAKREQIREKTRTGGGEGMPTGDIQGFFQFLYSVRSTTPTVFVMNRFS